MTCANCSRDYRPSESRCPHCGAPNPEAGVYQTSAVIVSAGAGHRVYQSVAEVPPRLRTRLERSTNGENSAIILIADRRGRTEIAKALRASPGAAPRRLARAILGEASNGPGAWFGRFPRPGRRALIVALAAFTVAVVATAFTHRLH